MNYVIQGIQDSFLKEAQSSPLLFADLANMETYIAESYQDRSIIEFIQNADDAKAKRFLIKKYKNSIIVANDGRVFSEDDVKAICRSGASNKKRGNHTIGYRGIGFKSVVNFAERVHIISKDIKMTFSRELTNKLLNDDIKAPLIRIPHNFTPLKDYNLILDELLNDEFNTIFIFEDVYFDNLIREIKIFDSSALLFLRNIRQVEFDCDISKYISVKRERRTERIEKLTILDEGSKEGWLVIRSLDNGIFESVAFMLNEKDTIIPMDAERAVVHSFMPTKDHVGIPIKINGDFSTDPSRTKVIIDDATIKSINNCVALIFGVIERSFSEEESTYLKGIYDVLKRFNADIYGVFKQEQSFRNLFKETIKNYASRNKWFRINKEILISVNQIKTNPKWLNSNDFNTLVKQDRSYPITIQDEKAMPGLIAFVEEIGAQPLSIEEILDVSLTIPASEIGAVEIINEIATKNRFNFNSELKSKLLKAKIIKVNNRMVSISEIDSAVDKLDETFVKLLIKDTNNLNDIEWLFKQLNYDVHSLFPQGSISNVNLGSSKNKMNTNDSREIMEPNLKQISITDSKNGIFSKDIKSQSLNDRIFSKGISKWRTAETNLGTFLETSEGVIKVEDVSKSNLGYDLEVHTNQGIKYLEVKSVENMGASFSITNNEYSTANELGAQFILAIVRQDDKVMEVCFIEDPVNTLNLIKRVTRWEWVCDEYSGNLVTYDF
ncbi:DUF3883 domain-containing protein [Bacillus paramycoides]|uniref:DUF3883 domain-containing protein n=1 Tax=Bacillus paramycoides TaxID=2026194 RepID=UPI003CFC1C45